MIPALAVALIVMGGVAYLLRKRARARRAFAAEKHDETVKF